MEEMVFNCMEVLVVSTKIPLAKGTCTTHSRLVQKSRYQLCARLFEELEDGEIRVLVISCMVYFYQCYFVYKHS